MIGKLYIIPFTSILVAASSNKEADELVGNNPQFLSDLKPNDIVRKGDNYFLTKPYLGNTKVIVAPTVQEALRKCL